MFGDLGHQTRHAGFALKLHQRAWALERGIEKITWTFDPLVRRNGYFNIAKLGVRVVEYLPNFYGEMLDRVNAGDQSDRMLVEWPLIAPTPVDDPPVPERHAATVLEVAADGRPRRLPWRSAEALVCVPADIERLRVERPGAAREWRLALRAELGGLLGVGGRVTGFSAAAGYLVANGELD